jgi:hypothetical protein
MAEIRRGLGDERQDGQRLPWLEPVEDEEYYPEPQGGGGWLKWTIIGIAVLAVLVVAGVMLRGWHAQTSDVGTLIKAESTPYKVRPADPGGLKVDNNDRVAQRTGVGSDINSPLDLAALPEEPIVGAGARLPQAQPQTQTSAAPQQSGPVKAASTDDAKPKPAETVAPKPEQAAPSPPTSPADTGSGGGMAQLGAFSTEAKAREAWKTLSKRFSYLAPLTPVILPVKSGDATLYRLRASGGPAASICARLKVAGEACAVVR